MFSPPSDKSDNGAEMQKEKKARTVEDSVHLVDSDIHPVTEVMNIISDAEYSLTHAMRGVQTLRGRPQALRSRHPAFLLR